MKNNNVAFKENDNLAFKELEKRSLSLTSKKRKLRILEFSYRQINTIVDIDLKTILEEISLSPVVDMIYVRHCCKRNKWTIKDIYEAYIKYNQQCSISQLVSCDKSILKKLT